jgi:hypothetical protein
MWLIFSNIKRKIILTLYIISIYNVITLALVPTDKSSEKWGNLKTKSELKDQKEIVWCYWFPVTWCSEFISITDTALL